MDVATAIERESYDESSAMPPEARPPMCGCRKLLLAVIEDIFVVRALASRARRTGALAEQVAADQRWLESEADSPFSLRWVCYHLQLNPADVRRLYQEKVRVPGLWGRSRAEQTAGDGNGLANAAPAGDR